MTTPQEMLPCPFCGKPPKYEQNNSFHTICCMQRGCAIAEVCEDSFDEAAKRWNARQAAAPQGREALESSFRSQVFHAAERANKRFGQWMPQQWLEIFIGEMTVGDQAVSLSPSIAMSGVATIEQIAHVLYECEKRRATHADAVMKAVSPRASDALLMEPFDECAEVFRSDAAAVLGALTPAVAPDAGAGEAIKEAKEKLYGVVNYLHADDDKHSGRAKSSTDSIVDKLVAAIAQAQEPGEAREQCDWPTGEFSFLDEPGKHDPCYVVMPGGAMLELNHHTREGVDIVRAKFIITACNAAIAQAQGFRNELTEDQIKLICDQIRNDLSGGRV